MANSLTQSTQTAATSAPDYYNNYLSNLASSGTAAGANANYVGATDLQNQAFGDAATVGDTARQTMTTAGDTLGRASDSNSPLSAADQYLQGAATDNLGQSALSYMSPYLGTAAQSMADINQRNIMQSLGPSVTANSVGSGQFGSQRGAQAFGQAIANSNQNLQNQIAQMYNTGFGNALTTAEQQNQLLGQLGSTAGNLASTGQQNLTQIGAQQGNLGQIQQNADLADLNAKATLGEQQRTLEQNKELFPLTTLQQVSQLLQGAQVPTTVTTQANPALLSTLGGIGAAGLGMITPIGSGVKDANGNLVTPLSSLTSALSGTALGNMLGITNSTAPGNAGANQAGPPAPGTANGNGPGVGQMYDSNGNIVSDPTYGTGTTGGTTGTGNSSTIIETSGPYAGQEVYSDTGLPVTGGQDFSEGT